MDLDLIEKEIVQFNSQTHGSSDYYKDEVYVKSRENNNFAPFSFVKKKLTDIKSFNELINVGYVYDSFDMFPSDSYVTWFEKQFGRKINRKQTKQIGILTYPNNKIIIDAITHIYKNYEILRNENIILNGKNFPTQLGEWYAKNIFGLRQVKSASQRGFDFYLNDKQVEVKVSWSDVPSPKGSKIKKSLVQLSDYCVVIYMARNFLVREICFLDSSYIMRKHAEKGHTIFLKDSDISNYFFSRSDKHYDKVMNSDALLKYASPTLAMKLAERFQ